MRVFIDANAFVSSWVLDLVMSLADDGFLEPFWSDAVLDEAARAISSVRSRPIEAASRLLGELKRFYPSSMVAEKDWRPLEPWFDLPDPGDAHVAAAAAYARCDVLLTYNLRDFPRSALASWGIEPIGPDELAMRCVEADADGVADAVSRLVTGKSRPPRTFAEEAAGLRRDRLPRFAAFVEGRLCGSAGAPGAVRGL